jgi:N-sulfoglucosamine sulfohydrolase
MKLKSAIVTLVLSLVAAVYAQERPNILLILADDMNWDSPGFAGGVMPDATPHLDHLASQSRYFTKAHVTVAVCQPSRQSMMTGLYPPNNGALGFKPIAPGVPTLSGLLADNGYFNAIYGKIGHMTPIAQFRWDRVEGDIDKRSTYALGRDPDFAYQCTKEYIRQAKEAGKPFFINANAADPHRPFHASNDEKGRFKKIINDYPDPSKVYHPDEVPVPPFLPDLPGIRNEMAQYASSVRRADDVVGATLRALKESGEADNTIVIFLSDNGMPFLFGKWDVYANSTRTPLLVRWPGNVKPGRDDEHFVSAVDLMPTLLEIAGIKAPANLDGCSLLPLLQDQPVDDWREVVITAHYEAVLYGFALKGIAKREKKTLAQLQREYEKKGWVVRENADGTMDLPINKRAIHMDDFVYIYNPWVILNMENRGESGGTLQAMKIAAENDDAVKQRLDFYLNRVPEEFYYESKDPHCLDNLIDNPEFAPKLEAARHRMQEWMDANDDPNADEFRRFLDGSLKQALRKDEPATADGFQVFDGKLSEESELGYLLTADEGRVVWALKPIGSKEDVVQVKAMLRIGKRERTPNACLAFGDGTSAEQVLKVGFFGGKDILSVLPLTLDRPVGGIHTAATMPRGEAAEFTVTIDQAKRTILVDLNGTKLTAAFPKNIQRITHAGYANVRSKQECSPLEIQ